MLAQQAQVGEVAVKPLPPLLMKALSLFSPLLRELQEVRYQFDRPFVVDSSGYTQRFGEAATPVDTQAKSTVDWWRARPAD